MNEHFSMVPVSKYTKASQSLFPVSVLEKVGKNINWIDDYIDRSRVILNALPWLVNTCSLTPVFKSSCIALLLSLIALSGLHNQQQEWRDAQSLVL